MVPAAPNTRASFGPVVRAAVLLGVILWGVGEVGTAGAQIQPEQLRLVPLSPAAKAENGVQLLRHGQAARARPLLRTAVAAKPALMLARHGAGVYWLGEAYAQTGDSAQARAAWRRGFRRLDAAGRFDVRLADAYLRSLSPAQLRSQRLRAVDAYTQLLRRVGTDTSAAVQGVFRRRVGQIAPLLPDDVFAKVVKGERDAEPGAWTFRPRAGAALQTWWRGLDPFPATEENERLEEHLTRLVHVRRSFSCGDRATALDARGTTYLRFGAPFKRRDLNYKSGDFFREVFRFGVPIPPASFPESEIWVYPQIDDAGVYLFAEEETSDCFALATVNDLLPSTLTMRRSDSERGLNIAYSSMMAMQAIYQELALYHSAYSDRYAEIASYVGRQETKAAIAEVAETFGREQNRGAEQSVVVGAGIGQTRRVFANPSTGLSYPTQFVSRMVSKAKQEDAAVARRREENMPRQYTALHEGTSRFPVAVRTARFLNDDGTTRTEVYWGVRAAEVQLPVAEEDGEPAPSLVRFAAVRHSHDRSRTQRKQQRHQLSAEPDRDSTTIVGVPVSFRGEARHHLTMQWAQHRLRQDTDGSIAGLGPKRRFTLVRADSLRPLRADGRRLEMSDLKVLSLPDTSLAALTAPADAARPYPFSVIAPDTPLLLSFEVYHLTYGPNDRTTYTVTYEVEGRTRRGWTRLFRGQDTQRTSTTMTRSDTARRSDEHILLDLSEISGGEDQDVRVTVRVTDEHTGVTVTRSLDFVLRPRDGS